jgi:hypothetical protein
MTGSVTPDHILTLGGYWDWDSTGIMIHCGWDHIARAMIQIKSFLDCFTTLVNPNLHGPREKNKNIYTGTQKRKKRERSCLGYRHYSSLTLSGGL